MLSVLFIVGFSSYKDLRKNPGSIVLALSILSIISSLGAIVTSFNHFINEFGDNDDADADESLCETIGYFAFACICLTFLYQGSFFIYYSRSTKLHQHHTRTLGPGYHIIPFIMTVISMIIAYWQTGFGRTVYGSCELKTSSNVGYSTFNFIGLVGSGLCMLFEFKRSIKRADCANHSHINLLKHYQKYLIVLCFLYAAVSTNNFLITTFIRFYNPQSPNFASIALVISGVCASSLKALNPFIILIAWTRDPDSREILRNHLKDYYCFSWIWAYTLPYGHLPSIDQDRSESSRNLLGNESFFDPSHSIHSDKEHNDSIDINSKEYKFDTIFTALIGIRYYLRIQKQNKSTVLDIEGPETLPEKKQPQRKENKDIKLVITNEIMHQEIPEILESIPKKEYKILSGTLTAHCYKLFKEIMALDDVGRYLQLSLDLENNFHKMQKRGTNPEGRNRSFYFPSSDNKVIFKSVSNSELNSFLKMLPNYVNYLQTTPYSLLSKVYGAFTYEIANPYQKQNILVMSNINRYPAYNIERTYELTGGILFRRTIMDEFIEKSELKHCGILKDFDFNKFEGSIKVGLEVESKLIQALKQDVEFLVSQRRTDYILSLYIVKKGVLPSVLSMVEETEAEYEESLPDLERPVRIDSIVSNMTQSTFDVDEVMKKASIFNGIESRTENVEYVLGITDYLNEFGFKQKMNLLLRKVGLNSSRQNLTTEEPGIYGRRLINYIERIVES